MLAVRSYDPGFAGLVPVRIGTFLRKRSGTCNPPEGRLEAGKKKRRKHAVVKRSEYSI
jgi:hypothetical protein